METEEPILLRIVRSLRNGDHDQWSELIAAMSNLVQRGFFKAGGRIRDAGEFQDWFPGWLYGKRIEALSTALEEKTASGECPDAASQNAFLENYLASAINSAVADFHKRDRRVRSFHEAEDFPGRASRTDDAEFREQRQRLHSALAELPDNVRVPFRLKFYAVVGPLTEADIEYLTAQSGLRPNEIRRLIETELRNNAGKKSPISSLFIGGLLGIPAADDGRNTTVDQRVARARGRLRKRLGCDE